MTKYDDVGETAVEKKKARRIQVGQGKVEAQKIKPTHDPSDSTSFNKKIGSDYYATNEEDPLLGSKSFKKKKGMIGQKRTRVEEDEGDIIEMLESQALS